MKIGVTCVTVNDGGVLEERTFGKEYSFQSESKNVQIFLSIWGKTAILRCYFKVQSLKQVSIFLTIKYPYVRFI